MDQPVKLYTLSTCSFCKAAKEFLDDCSIPYEFTDVDLLDPESRAEIIKKLKEQNPVITFPTIFIKDKMISGFKKDEIEEALKT